MTAEIDKDLLTWMKRRWKKSGGDTQEITICHFKGGGAPQLICALTRNNLESFASNEELCREIDERMIEESRHYPGERRFEVTLFTAGNRPIDSNQFRKMGLGRPESEGVDFTINGQLEMLVRQNGRMFETTIGTLQRANESLERRVNSAYSLVDQLMTTYPQLIDAINRLGNEEVEREIRRRQALRIEGLKDRAIQRVDQAFPFIVNHLTGGKLNLLEPPKPGSPGNAKMMSEIEPHLMALVHSLANAGERGLKISEHMTDDEKQWLMAIVVIIQQANDAKGQDIGVKQNGSQKNADPPSTS